MKASKEITTCTFGELGVLPVFVEKLAERSITCPTAIQRQVIPSLLEGNNIVFRSATGTGKTFAYLIPALQRIMTDLAAAPYSGPALMVCAPTLELCSQIKQEVDFLLAGAWNVTLLSGVANTSRQIDSLKKNKPLAVVGNPGRLLLLAKMGKLSLRGLRFLVLDEADRLTASECREEMTALAQHIVARNQHGKAVGFAVSDTPLVIAACSATVTAKTGEYLRPLLENAALIESDEQEILRERIEHWAIFSEGRRKSQTLVSFLCAVRPKKTLVFTNRSHDVGKLVSILQKRQINAVGLFSGMDKKERKAAIDRFRSGKAAVLVSSDLSARGLDIPGISHVLALDVSEHRETYIHRAGRTGRAGKYGIMVSIGDEVEMHRLAAIEKKLKIVVYPKELYGGRLIGE
ncbi:MAG: DEAD/DEAH box helicase [Treponema sp.]|nr:DEAD/DEAH box helicase [Treponema sp.]